MALAPLIDQSENTLTLLRCYSTEVVDSTYYIAILRRVGGAGGYISSSSHPIMVDGRQRKDTSTEVFSYHQLPAIDVLTLKANNE